MIKYYKIWHIGGKSMQNRAARISKYKRINLTNIANETVKKLFQNSHVLDHPYGVVIIGGSGSEKKYITYLKKKEE